MIFSNMAYLCHWMNPLKLFGKPSLWLRLRLRFPELDWKILMAYQIWGRRLLLNLILNAAASFKLSWLNISWWNLLWRMRNAVLETRWSSCTCAFADNRLIIEDDLHKGFLFRELPHAWRLIKVKLSGCDAQTSSLHPCPATCSLEAWHLAELLEIID